MPPELCDTVSIGSVVSVPFGGRSKKNLGVVFELKQSSEFKRLKPISQVISQEPPLPEELIKLADYIKEKTFCTYFEAVKCMLPQGVKHKVTASYAFNPNYCIEDCIKQPHREILEFLKEKEVFINEEKIFSNLKIDSNPDILKDLLKQDAVLIMSNLENRMKDKVISLVRLSPDYENVKTTAKQRTVINLLIDFESAQINEICEYCGVTPAVVKALIKNGALETFEVPLTVDESEVTEKKEIVLTDEQNAAFGKIKNDINKGEYSVTLLYGVTGSGKTSVYLKAIDETLEKGLSSLVLVPEIGLTPQALKIFTDRYGSCVAVLHSALSIRQRANEWKKINNGECKIVIGTRSAVFAPIKKLGFAVIDEEQEHTYKSEMSPRYNAIEVAKFRAAYNKCPLLLVSATPSVESFAMAKAGKYKLITLKNRYSSAMLPQVKVVDMRYAKNAVGCKEMSQELCEEIDENLKNKQQSILFINRRGFNTFAACTACGSVVTCPNCSISMTYHSVTGNCKCHYCGYSIPFTTICPSCKNDSVRYAGYGTQKIEEEIKRLFPSARLIRLDADVTGTKDSHEKILTAFSNGEYDILIGTQMVAKGLDFPNVTLVGVISVDSQLYNDDFRSLEKTFSLLTQVVGRSGRGDIAGRAVIQTLTPENEIIDLAARQDYDAFFETEIKIRKIMTYPPYCDMCVICFVGEDEIITKNCAFQMGKVLNSLIKEKYSDIKVIILGPMPARIEKIQNKYRYRIIIKCRNNVTFRSMIREMLTNEELNKKYKNVTMYADMNPDTIL